MGKVGITKVESVTNQQINSIIVRDYIDSDYIYYNLYSRKEELQRLATSGSAQPILNKAHFSQLKMSLPPLPEQKAIASILGALDDKIELNRRMNETLEAMARTIFKSWFVDFDPIPGLGPHKEWQESPLGKIPKGWKVGVMGNLVNNVVERVQPSSFTESIPYVPIECISPRTVCLSESQPGSNARSSLVLFRRGDILFGAMRPYFHKVCIAPFNGTTRTTAFVLRPDPSELGHVAFVVSRDETIEYSTAHSEGSTIPYAKWTGSLEALPIVLPSIELRRRFHSLTEPIIHRMMNSVIESRTLAAVRDALLPKLLSGEIRVKDAEKFLKTHL